MSIEPLLINASRMGQAAQAVKSLAQSGVRLTSSPAVSKELAQTMPSDVAALSGQSKPSMGLGKAALAMVAGLLLFFIMGPRALKFAAKGAGVLAKALFNPQALTGLVHKGLMFFGMLEAALPVMRHLGLGHIKLPPQLVSLAGHLRGNPGVIPLSTTRNAFGNASGLLSSASEALPKAAEFAGNLLKQAPPGLQQKAQQLFAQLATFANTFKNTAGSVLPNATSVPASTVLRSVV